jgi:flagellar FliJ protein
VTPFRSQIRLQKFRLDEIQRQVAELDRLAVRLKGDLAGLEAEACAEQEAAKHSADAGFAYGAYAAHLVDRRRKLMKSIDEVEVELAQAREQLRDAFAELKKYELAAAAAVERANKRREARDQVNLDEIALGIFRRRKIG